MGERRIRLVVTFTATITLAVMSLMADEVIANWVWLAAVACLFYGVYVLLFEEEVRS